MAYIKAACISIAQKVDAGEAPPRKKPDDGDGGWLRPKEVGLFKEAPVSDTVSGHHFQGMLDLIEEQALKQPAAEKAKEKPKGAKDWTCKYTGCNVKYPDATSSGASRKYNYGFCSSECRELMRKAPRAPPPPCKHGRQKSRCKDCGTAYCKHGRWKHKCKDCGTGHCQHGRQKQQCEDCGRQ
jgi:hypothetical protein